MRCLLWYNDADCVKGSGPRWVVRFLGCKASLDSCFRSLFKILSSFFSLVPIDSFAAFMGKGRRCGLLVEDVKKGSEGGGSEGEKVEGGVPAVY